MNKRFAGSSPRNGEKSQLNTVAYWNPTEGSLRINESTLDNDSKQPLFSVAERLGQSSARVKQVLFKP